VTFVPVDLPGPGAYGAGMTRSSRLAQPPVFAKPGDLQRRVIAALPGALPAERVLLRSAATKRWWSQLSGDEMLAIQAAEKRAH